jgi:hypothetical protein
LETKLAATLLALRDIPYEHAKQLSAKQIISRYQFDHYPMRKSDGGPDEPWNLRPLLIAAHREKTAKIDAPARAKDRRIESKWKHFMTATSAGKKPPKRLSQWQRRRSK